MKTAEPMSCAKPKLEKPITHIWGNHWWWSNSQGEVADLHKEFHRNEIEIFLNDWRLGGKWDSWAEIWYWQGIWSWHVVFANNEEVSESVKDTVGLLNTFDTGGGGWSWAGLLKSMCAGIKGEWAGLPVASGTQPVTQQRCGANSCPSYSKFAASGSTAQVTRRQFCIISRSLHAVSATLVFSTPLKNTK